MELEPGIRMEHTWQDVTYKQGEGKDFNYRVTDWVPSWTSAFRLDDRNLFRLAYNTFTSPEYQLFESYGVRVWDLYLVWKSGIGIGETSSSFGVIQLLRNEIECAGFRALHLGKRGD